MLLVEKEEDRVNVHYEYVEGFDYFTRRIRTVSHPIIVGFTSI